MDSINQKQKSQFQPLNSLIYHINIYHQCLIARRKQRMQQINTEMSPAKLISSTFSVKFVYKQ